MIMKTKTLGLHLGTSAIGWAIVSRDENLDAALVDSGVFRFKDGVMHTQNGEEPMTQARTLARSQRRNYFRRRLRKIELLKVLVRNGMCPYVSDDELAAWKEKKVYPCRQEFFEWQKVDAEADRNPYHDRYRCLTERLDFGIEADRHAFGRAMYHMAQRRGFLSNRKSGKGKDDGAVLTGIAALDSDMRNAGCAYLGEYLYKMHRQGRKVRGLYTAREAHYEKEFNAICDRQRVDGDIRDALHEVIFHKRGPKSQKGAVGRCSVDPSRRRCQKSHPAYEEFRMLQDLNNIRVKTASDEDFRPLDAVERQKAAVLFYRKSKSSFKFEDIAKKIAGKGNYCSAGDGMDKPYVFNYRMYQTFGTCQVTAGLMSVFGEDWEDALCRAYTLGDGKTKDEIVNDVWHALSDFNDDDRLEQWARERLGLDAGDAARFVSIEMPDGYASVSLRTIRKTLPFLRRGCRYDEAVMLSGLRALMRDRSDTDYLHYVEEEVSKIVRDGEYDVFGNRRKTVRNSVKDFLKDCPGVRFGRIEWMHDGRESAYRPATGRKAGVRQLDSPRVPGLKNPMAMRTLFMLRTLLNGLLAERKIDENTKVNIELSRELNDRNSRKAIAEYQRNREEENRRFAAEICKYVGDGFVPTEDDILKYRLWEEQNHTCPYTLRQIEIDDFLGMNPDCELDYILPLSRGGEKSQTNMVLCDMKYNRERKHMRLPSEMPEHAAILEAVKGFGWNEEADRLRRDIEKTRNHGYMEKDARDRMMVARRKKELRLVYLENKIRCFETREPSRIRYGMEGGNTSVVRRFAYEYLKSLFMKVYPMKDLTTAAFRSMWGVEKLYCELKGSSYACHAVNAITLACVGKKDYDLLARFLRDTDEHKYHKAPDALVEMPWRGFVSDVRSEVQALLIPYRAQSLIGKNSRKKVRKRGVVQKNSRGEVMYAQGHTARCRLHEETLYGSIVRDGVQYYVIRKGLDKINEKEVGRIVDDVVRGKVEKAVAEKGLKAAVAEGIMMNEELGIPIRKVRLYTDIRTAIDLKPHRDVSVSCHKRHVHVVNDGNHAVAIYSGAGKNGKEERSFELITNFDASMHYVGRSGRRMLMEPEKDGMSLKYVLKQGTMVLFYEDSPEEVRNCSYEELSGRLYRVIGLSRSDIRKTGKVYHYGALSFRHHAESRNTSELTTASGAWKNDGCYKGLLKMLHTQIKALVEGYDFIISPLGRIQFIERD